MIDLTQRTQIVMLVKVDSTVGGLRAGARQETKHPAGQPHTDAVRAAFAQLKRACPDENPMCWEEAADASR